MDTRTRCDRSCSKTAIAFQQASLNYVITTQTKRSKAIPGHLFFRSSSSKVTPHGVKIQISASC
ncbi:MAG: hypothetical protein ACYTXA_22315 [Nostoc sp.]